MLRFFFFFDLHVHFPFDLILLAVRSDVESLTLDLALHFFSFSLILRMSFDFIPHLYFAIILRVVSVLIFHRGVVGGVGIEVAFVLLFFPDFRQLQNPSAMSSSTAKIIDRSYLIQYTQPRLNNPRHFRRTCCLRLRLPGIFHLHLPPQAHHLLRRGIFYPVPVGDQLKQLGCDIGSTYVGHGVVLCAVWW
jgi:hypothetical protein